MPEDIIHFNACDRALNDSILLWQVATMISYIRVKYLLFCSSIKCYTSSRTNFLTKGEVYFDVRCKLEQQGKWSPDGP